MKTRNKKILSKAIIAVLLSVVMMGCEIENPSLANAVDISVSDYSIIKPKSISSDNSNIEKQNYRYGKWYYSWNWSNPIESYLVKTDDGLLMRMEPDPDGNYKILYYTEEYRIVKNIEIKKELDIFGGFYAGTDGYYIISGQNNPNESPSVECFRITKYDKNWNRISSTGLYDCNTVEPFYAGSLRVAEYGDYLVIRTSHKMYRSERDGLNHQANVTIEYDKTASAITDSFTGVMNTNYGYVSHSFNQFVHIDNGKLVALDHGDAYPRSIVLIKYNTDITSGKFVPDYYTRCTYKEVIPFSGNVGANYTGAEVGGFECSDSSYLIAGTSENYPGDDHSNSYSTRNIFVSVVSKYDNSVKTIYLTDFSDTDMTANNPQLIKINDDRFIIIWTKKQLYNTKSMGYSGKIYYAVLDGEGQLIGDVKEEIGYLSDCHPIVVGNKVIWYVYNDSKTVFFELDSDTLELKQDDGREKGDINGDGKTNIADALMLSRADAGLVTLAWFEEKVSDVNGDGKVNIADALMISRYDAGLIDKLK